MIRKNHSKSGPKKILPGDAAGNPDSKVLSEREEKYHRLLENMTDGFVAVNMQGIIREFNHSFQEMVGYEPDELVQLTFKDLTPEIWHSYEDRIVLEQILKRGHSFVYEKEYRKKDGTLIPVELRTFLIRNESGENEGMWAIVRDITHKKKSEELKKESEFWLKESQSFGHLGSYTLDFQTNLWSSSEILDDIFGIQHDPDKTIDTWISVLHPEDKEEMTQYFQNWVIAGKNSFDKEYRIIRQSDNEERWVWGNGVLSFNEDGSIAKMFGIIQDITERKHIVDVVSRSEIEYRSTIDALPEWIYVVDDQLHFVMINHSLRTEFLDCGILTDRIGTVISPKYPFISKQSIAEIEKVFRTGETHISEEKVEMGNKILYCELRKIPIFKGQNVIKVITVIRDRSKEKEIENLKLKSNEDKEVLLREIHHRVKNNLAIVISLLNFQLRSANNPDLIPIIHDIQMRIRSMALIHEHLYLSENIDRIPLDSYIQSLVNSTLGTFSGSQVIIKTRLDPMEANIEKALPIGLIINELLTNAVKYAFKPGKEAIVEVNLARDNEDNCTLTVKDNGIGLPADLTLESDKTMGLYIVGLLTRQLEGKIDIVRSNGTTFTITFLNPTERNTDGILNQIFKPA
jgi:PAS domain S-box-containing protein